jgi:hypothetical protein
MGYRSSPTGTAEAVSSSINKRDGPDARQAISCIERKVNRIAILAGFAVGYVAYLVAMREWGASAVSAKIIGIATWLVAVIFVRYQFKKQ